MISNVSNLVTQFEDLINSNEYIKAYELATNNNLLFSHMNPQGKSCASLIFNALQPYLSVNGHDIYSKLKEGITQLLDYFLEKEPHYWYYKDKTDFSIYDDSVYIWPLTYMCFNNKEKIKFFFSNMEKDIISHGSLKSKYFMGRKIDPQIIALSEKLLLPEEITIKDIVELKNSNPTNFKDLLSIYENHRNNGKIIYNHETTIELFKTIFNIPANELKYFTETFQTLVTFFKPLLLKNCTSRKNFSPSNINLINHNTKRQRYEDIFQTVLLDSNSNNLYLIPALNILEKEFPEKSIESYFKNNINFRFIPQLLGLSENLERKEYCNIEYDSYRLHEPTYIINKNKEYIFKVCDIYFSNILTTLLAGNLSFVTFKENIHLKNEKIENYQAHYPEQFAKDWKDFKTGLELLELPLYSSDKDMSAYLQYLNLHHSIPDKLDVVVNKKKI